MTDSIFNNVRVVMVGTTHAGNIGAAARAMKTMGLQRLSLVAPRSFPAAEATAMAAGADDLLAGAVCYDSLAEALADVTLVFATSARPRRLAWPMLTPRGCAAQVVQAPPAEQIALVFGRERTVLTNSELALCHALVEIPANPDYSSLNVASAVQVLAYELRVAALAAHPPEPAPAAGTAAPMAEVERFYEHLEAVLLHTGFLDQGNPRHLMRRLRRLFNRARPDQNEVNILRGILSAVQGNKQGRDG